MSRTTCSTRCRRAGRGVVEQQMRLVEDEHELGPVQVAHFGQRLEQLREEPEQEARVKARFQDELVGGQDVDDPAPAQIRSEQIGQLQGRLAEKGLATLALEREQAPAGSRPPTAR
jgi:hypothetical protein